MKKQCLFLSLIVLSSLAQATLTAPDIDSVNWVLYDDMQGGLENLYENWDIECSSSAISVGTGSLGDDDYTCVWTDSGKARFATLTPQITQETLGVSARLKLTDLTTGNNAFCMTALAAEILPDAYFYFGLFYVNGKLKGTFATEQYGEITVYGDAPYFDFEVGTSDVPYYDLAIIFEDATKTFWMYLNDEFFAYASIPLDEISFGTPFIEVYTNNTEMNLCLQDFEFAIPEPVSLLLFGLGGLLIRKR